MVGNTFEILGESGPQLVEKAEADGVAIGAETPDFENLTAYYFKHPPLEPKQMRIKVHKSGLWHSDTCKTKGEWGSDNSLFPLVPGHEICGLVTEKGDDVKGYDIGQRVGFGPFGQACFNKRTCEFCRTGRNDLCREKAMNYDPNWGGWATSYQDDHRLYVNVPEELDFVKAAPIMCAGATVYSPLVDHGYPGAKVCIMGIGGLGHLAVKYAAHLGMHVTVISSSEAKRAECMEFGAEEFVISSDTDAMSRLENQFDLFLACASTYTIADWIKYLRGNGKMIIVGLPEVSKSQPFNAFNLIVNAKQLVGSLVASQKVTQDIINLSARYPHLVPETEEVAFNVPEADAHFKRVHRSDPTPPKYRLVYDILGTPLL